MVNTGRRSAGCFTCRKRRVKCDERKPYCFKCEKTSNKCDGYPNPTDLLFRNENDTARKNAVLGKSSRARRANEYNNVTSYTFSRRFSGSQRLTVEQASVNGFCPCPSINELASPHGIEQLVFYHLFSNANVSRNCLLRISRDMCLAAKPSSALLPVTQSLAWINAPIEYNPGKHFIRARQEYTDTIAKLRNTLRDPSSVSPNETLLVILLVSMIEPVLGDPNSIAVTTLAHLGGASSFIESSRFGASLPGACMPLLAFLMNNMILGCLGCPAERAAQLLSMLKSLYLSISSTLSLPLGSARILELGISAVDVHIEVKVLESIGWIGISRSQINMLVEKCTMTLKDISEWSHLWEPKARSFSADEGNGLFTVKAAWNRSDAPESLSLWFRKDWSQICLYQLLLHVASRRCVKQLSKTIDTTVESAEEEIRVLKNVDSKIQEALDNVAQEIKDFVPIFLGAKSRDIADEALPRIAAYAMLKPLQAAITVPGLGMRTYAELKEAVDLIASHARISREFLTDRVCATLFD